MYTMLRLSASLQVAARLCAAASVALLSATASAVDAVLYATTIPDAAGWSGETSAVGDPTCGPCPCDSGDAFATPGDTPTIVYLEATNFQNFVLPAGYAITNVNADVMCRYDTGTSWDVQIRYSLNGTNDLLLGNFTLGSSSLTTCRYRTGTGGNIAAPAGGWTAAAVNSLRVKIRQQVNANRLRVKAFRITVTYVAIDSDNDGVPDINDCAPNDPTIATPRVFYRDADGDGFGNAGIPTQPLCQLNPPAGFVANSTDCNDANALINPNTRWYLDDDGDGFGDPNFPSAPQCTQPTGYVLSNTDLCPTDPDKIAPGPCGCEVPETDVNLNGIPDCTESTSILRTVWSTSVPAATGWTNPSNAASASQPTCGESCNCDSGGVFASSASTEWLEAADFASMAIPSGFTGANVRVDVQCRADNPTDCTIRVDAYSGSSTTPLYNRQTVFSTADGQCRYRIGRVRGYTSTPSGGWTAAALESIRVRVQRPGGPANTLRVKSFRVQALLVDRDTDRDGLTDTVDPCPNLANGSVDCNGNGLGDACEISQSPSTRDVNGNGVLDSCESVVGWVGGTSGSFTTPAAWTSGVVPGPGSNVYLSSSGASTATISTSALATIGSLTISSGTVKLNLGANFTVLGNVTVAPGATLIVDGALSTRMFDVGAELRVRVGAKFEVGGLASVRISTTGSMVTEALTTLSLSIRTGVSVPLSIQGTASLNNGIIVKFGSVTGADLTLGRQFKLIDVSGNAGQLFRSLATQSTLDGKFLRSVTTSSLIDSLLVEVTLQSQFVAAAGGASGSLGATTVPTAVVADNFNPAPDLFDDVAVCARKYSASGAELGGALYVFQSTGTAGTLFAQTIEYPIDVGPVAIDSADLDLDGDMDIAVLNTVSGTLQVFRNGPPASNSIDRFTFSAPFTVTGLVGSNSFSIAKSIVNFKNSLLPAGHKVLVGNSTAATLRAVAYSPAGPLKGNPITVPPLGAPGPSSPIDDTSRTDGWFACTFRREANADSGSIARVDIVTDGGGLPRPQIDAGSVRAGPDFPVAIESGDLNQDAFEDVVVVGASTSTSDAGAAVALYSGASIGSFSPPGVITLLKRPLDVAIGKFDSDNKNDFLVAFGTADQVGEQGEFARLYQNIVGQAGAAPAFESNTGDNLFVGKGVRRIERAYLNNVGNDDVAFAGESTGGTGSNFLPVQGPYGATGILQVTAIPPNCSSDLTGDGRVDSSDLGILLGSWGLNGIADINGDDIVDSADLTLVLGSWGNCQS